MTNTKNNLWYNQNQLNDDNYDYIANVLCVPYRISAKIVANITGDVLLLTYRLDTYKAEVDEDKSCLRLLKRNRALNPKDKELYHFLRQFDGADCWADLIFYLIRNGNHVEAS